MTEQKYHIDINGVPAECFASERTCPRGGSQNHYSSLEEAQYYADFLNEIEVNMSLTKYIEEKKGMTLDKAKKRGVFVERIFKATPMERFNTKSFYYDSAKGVWNEERKKLQDKIIDKFMDKYKDVPCNKKVVFSAGLPGAGKTTVLKQIDEINLKDYAVINADDIKEEMAKMGMIPEIRGLTPLECAGLIHDESSKIADNLQKRLANQGKNVIYDMTSKKRESVERRMGIFKEQGYKVEDMTIVFVDIQLETSKQRAMERYTHGLNDYVMGRNNLGGRYIPDSVLEDCKPTMKGKHSKNQEVFENIVQDKTIPMQAISYSNEVYGQVPKRIY